MIRILGEGWPSLQPKLEPSDTPSTERADKVTALDKHEVSEQEVDPEEFLKAFKDEGVAFEHSQVFRKFLARRIGQLSLGVAVGSGLGIPAGEAGKMALKTETGQEIYSGWQINRVDKLFDEVAEDIRGHENFRQAFLPSRVEFLADELKSFETEKVILSLAERSQLSPTELLQNLHLDQVILYSDTVLDDLKASEEADWFMRERLRRVYASLDKAIDVLPGTSGTEVSKGVLGIDLKAIDDPFPKEDILRSRFTNYAGVARAEPDGQMFLNVSNMLYPGQDWQIDNLDYAQAARNKIHDVVMHEFMHLANSNHQGEGIAGDLYEGLTDAFAIEVRKDIGLYHGNRNELNTPGYHKGPTYAAQVLVESLGGFDSPELWRAYLKDYANFPSLFEARYGEGSFKGIFDNHLQLNLEPLGKDENLTEQAELITDTYQGLAVLSNLLGLFEPKDRDKILAAVNERNQGFGEIIYRQGQTEMGKWTSVMIDRPGDYQDNGLIVADDPRESSGKVILLTDFKDSEEGGSDRAKVEQEAYFRWFLVSREPGNREPRDDMEAKARERSNARGAVIEHSGPVDQIKIDEIVRDYYRVTERTN